MPSELADALTDPKFFMVGPDQELTFLEEPGPRPVWCPVISADDHMFESPTMFDSLPAKYRDGAPRWVDVDGRPAWQIGDQRHFLTGMDGAANRPISQWRSVKMRLEDYRDSVYDTAARVRDMDLNGVWASLCFPSITWGFAGTTFARLPDRDLAFACVQAYNDWVVEQWAGSQPDRLIPCQITYLADPELAAHEIYRNAKRGVHAVSFTENPSALGYPSIHTDHWDPFMKACAETETAINLHIGSAGKISCPSPDTPDPAQIALFPLNGIEAVVDLIFSGIPVRFPDTHFVLSEAGVSWVPMVVERLHRAARQRDAAPQAWAGIDMHPVDVLHRNFWFTSIEDPSSFHRLDVISEDRVMVEVDFPHTDSSWPDSQQLFRSELEHLPVEIVRKVCFENAAKLYHHPEPPEAMRKASTLLGDARQDEVTSVAIYPYNEPTYFDDMTPDSLRFTRELGKEGGVELGTILLGDDLASSPAVMMLELPPGGELPRHSHGTHRVEIVVRGSLQMADGRILTPGDVWTSGPDEFYGPHTAGPDGVMTAEIFASCTGLAPTPDPDSTSDGAAMAATIGAKAREAQGL